MNKQEGTKTMLNRLIPFVLLGGASMGAQAQNVTYVHTDLLGSPVLETDANANVVRQVDYRAYGEEVMDSPETGPGFTGHYRDAATGLVYAQKRYFDPAIGVFLSTDPVDASAGPIGYFNRFAYANNNPFTYTDPTGMAWWQDFKGGGAQMVHDVFNEPSNIGNFIVDEGPNVGMRTLGVVGGAGQVVLGGAICAGVVTCAGGGVLALHGASNIYEGFTGETSILRDGYRQVLGEDGGDLAYTSVDMVGSVGGLTRAVLKPGSWKLFRYTSDQYVPAFQTASATALVRDLAVLANDVNSYGNAAEEALEKVKPREPEPEDEDNRR